MSSYFDICGPSFKPMKLSNEPADLSNGNLDDELPPVFRTLPKLLASTSASTGLGTPPRKYRRLVAEVLLPLSVEEPCAPEKASATAIGLKTAADQGEADAQFMTGQNYLEGRGFRQNDELGFRYIEMAAEKGLAEAQYTLGDLYKSGRGKGLDYDSIYFLQVAVPEPHFRQKKAFYWFRQAALQGHARAQHQVGNAHATGYGGVLKNKREAVLWFRKAAHQGVKQAQYYTGIACLSGYSEEAQPYPEAVSWFQKAANQECARSQYQLGIAYAQGRGVEKDEKHARKWLEKAAEQGLMNAQYCLGVFCINSGDVAAAKWLKKAALQEHQQAQLLLSDVYANGFGVAVNQLESFKWLAKSANNGCATAQLRVAQLCGKGMTAKSRRQSVVWFKKAAENGLPEAQFELSKAYDTGCGIPINKEQAQRWLLKAAKAGHKAALRQLCPSFRLPPVSDIQSQWDLGGAQASRSKARIDLSDSSFTKDLSKWT